MPNPTKNEQKVKFPGAIQAYRQIEASKDGDLPDKIMLIKTGAWGNSVKGQITITSQDLREMKQNFDNGVGRFGGGSVGLPIDFSHMEWDKAAAWINALELQNSDSELWAAQVEWTDSGAAAVRGGDYKGISPSFYPSDRGGYVDPEDYDSEAKPNTLVGAGLTNIPFFKGLNALKASAFAQGDNSDILIISDNNVKKENNMTLQLDEVRVKASADLTQEEKDFIKANESELSQDEKVKFGIATPATPQTAENFSEQDRQVLADIASGAKVLMTKEEVMELNKKVDASAEAIAASHKKEVEAEVKTHIARGAIKADQAEKWVELIVADEANGELLKNLPNNQLVADSNEAGGEGGSAEDAEDKLHNKTVEVLNASRAEGKAMSYNQARQEAIKQLENGGNQ